MPPRISNPLARVALPFLLLDSAHAGETVGDPATTSTQLRHFDEVIAREATEQLPPDPRA
jgi:hypothetical protein